MPMWSAQTALSPMFPAMRSPPGCGLVRIRAEIFNQPRQYISEKLNPLRQGRNSDRLFRGHCRLGYRSMPRPRPDPGRIVSGWAPDMPMSYSFLHGPRDFCCKQALFNRYAESGSPFVGACSNGCEKSHLGKAILEED